MKLLEKILIPVNFENDDNSHIEIAIELSKKFNSKIIFINILPEEAKIESLNLLIVKQVNEKFNTFINMAQLEGVDLETRIEYGNKFEHIITIADNENVNVIVFPSKLDHSEDGYALDFLAEKLIRKSQKPVWIVKDGAKSFPEKILCSVDYSEASSRALNNAIKIARTFNKTLHIINVLEPLSANYSARFEVNLEKENQKKASDNKQAFENFLSGFNFVNVNYEATIIMGNPEKEIKQYIQENNIDLLFMGATGKTFFQRILLGSVTEKIIRQLPCSMVITKSENILNVKIDSDISEIEKHMSVARKLEKSGYYQEAIDQLQISLQKNDLHIPTLSLIRQLYIKIGDDTMANTYKQKIDDILKRLWSGDIENEIRKHYKI